ncbi:MAG: hypothetical protein AAFW60_01875 [Pseudomonadota bacterium]
MNWHIFLLAICGGSVAIVTSAASGAPASTLFRALAICIALAATLGWIFKERTNE